VKIYIVVRDVDLGVHVFGAFSSRGVAFEAVEKFCQQEKDYDPKQFYLLPAELDADCEHVA
jgi:hypothetical protein